MNELMNFNLSFLVSQERSADLDGDPKHQERHPKR